MNLLKMTKGKIEGALVGDKKERRYFRKSLWGKVWVGEALESFYTKRLTGV